MQVAFHCGRCKHALSCSLIIQTVGTNETLTECCSLFHGISCIWKLDGPMIFDNKSSEGTCKCVLLCCCSNNMLWLQLIHRTVSTPKSR